MSQDYDKNPIIIYDYGVLFELNYLLLVALIGLPFVISDLNIVINSENFLRFEILRLGVVFFVQIWIYKAIFFEYPKKFREKKSYFKFTNRHIEYHYFADNKNYQKIGAKIEISNIVSIDYCIVSELRDRFGRFHKFSAWQLYRKSSIGVHIGKATLFLIYFIGYFLYVLPYKIRKLYISKEPFSLLFRNITIKFNNRNYLLINIYREKELIALNKYFEQQGITIDNTIKFIPHLQNQGWFVDKEERWTNNFTEGDR